MMSESEAVHPLLREAEEALRRREVDRALELLSQVHPGDPPTFMAARQHMLSIYQVLKNEDQMFACLTSTLGTLTRAADLYRFADQLFAQRMYALAEPAYRKVIAQDATFTDAHIRLGMVYREQGDLPRAQQHLEQALQLDRKAQAARFLLATVCAQQEDYPRALTLLHVVLTQQPDNATARLLQAEVHQRVGDHRQALVEYSKLANEGSRDPQVYLKVATSLMALNDKAQLRLALERAVSLDPRQVRAALKLATDLEQGRDYEASYYYYDLVLQHANEHPLAHQGKERVRRKLYRASKDLDEEAEEDRKPDRGLEDFQPLKPYQPDQKALFRQQLLSPEVHATGPFDPMALSRVELPRGTSTAPLEDEVSAQTAELGPQGTQYLGLQALTWRDVAANLTLLGDLPLAVVGRLLKEALIDLGTWFWTELKKPRSFGTKSAPPPKPRKKKRKKRADEPAPSDAEDEAGEDDEP